MLRTRDAQGYPMQGVNVVPERPKPKSNSRDLVKLLQAKQRGEEANQLAEHWHRAYESINRDYLTFKDRDLCSACQRVKED